MLGGGEDFVALISHCTLKCLFHCTVLKLNFKIVILLTSKKGCKGVNNIS